MSRAILRLPNSLSRAAIPCPCLAAARLFSSSSSFASTSAQATSEAAPREKYTLPKGMVLKGIVTSTHKMPQTTTVTVERRVTDHKTLKEFKKHTKYLIHDPKETCVVGDQVSIRNCLPVSKRKRFELVDILVGARERAENMEGGVAAKSVAEEA